MNQKVFAIGDSSSGCKLNTDLVKTAAFGTPTELNDLLELHIEREWGKLNEETKRLITTNPTATEVFRNEAKQSFQDVRCTNNLLLDYAVNNGNLAVVSWILKNGGNPDGIDSLTDHKSIFDRCGVNSVQRARPDNLTKYEVDKLVFDAYTIAIKNGANINRISNALYLRPETALISCKNDEKIPMLLELGANPNPTWDRPQRKLAPLQHASWLAVNGAGSFKRVEILAAAGGNDLRGTQLEYELISTCSKQEHAKRCQQLSSIVKLSPGIIPGMLYKSKQNQIVSDEFSKNREICYFPEIQFYDDFDLLVIPANKRGLPLGVQLGEKTGETYQTNVAIDNPLRPVFLFLTAKKSTIWKVTLSKNTKVIGVIVDTGYSNTPRDAVIGIDDSTPVSMGNLCPGYYHWNENKFFNTQSILPNDMNPFAIQNRITITNPMSADISYGEDFTPKGWQNRISSEVLNTLGATSIKTKQPPLSIHEQLDKYIKEGRLKRVNTETFNSWIKQSLDRPWIFRQKLNQLPPYWDAYKIRDSNIPTLKGAPTAEPLIFFVEEGRVRHEDIIRLTGRDDITIFYLKNSNHNAIHGMSKGGSCSGPLCK